MKILIDEKFRDKVVKGIEDPVVRLFWQKEFLKYPDRFLAEKVKKEKLPGRKSEYHLK